MNILTHPAFLSGFIVTLIASLFGLIPGTKHLQHNLPMYRWKLMEWAFRWVSDADGDVGLRLFGVLTFIKYKEHTMFYWFRRFPKAGKWQGHETLASEVKEIDRMLKLGDCR